MEARAPDETQLAPYGRLEIFKKGNRAVAKRVVKLNPIGGITSQETIRFDAPP